MELIMHDEVGSVVSFTLGHGRIIKVSIAKGHKVRYTPLEGLEFNREGILREHPDLDNLPFKEMKIEAIKRLKNHIKDMNEDKLMKYLLEEMTIKHNYKPLMAHKPGFRPIKLRPIKNDVI